MRPAIIFFIALLFFITLGFLLGGPIEPFTSETGSRQGREATEPFVNIVDSRQGSKATEPFINVPEMPDLTKPVAKTSDDKDQANVNYRSVLTYIENNPDNVYNFVKDVKSKFFDEKCEYKNPMDVSNLTATYQPVF
jgi:hypothetical protein